MIKVIAIKNQKGGAGKTTIAIALASLMSMREQRVLLIDTDFTQESAMTWARLNDGRYFDVVVLQPSQLQTYIERNKDHYDYIFIDTPPRANAETVHFIKVAHLILIPVQPSPYDVWACNDLIEAIKTRQEITAGMRGVPPEGLPAAAFIMSRATKYSRIVGETEAALNDVGFHIFESMTTQYDTYKRSAITGHTVFDCPEKNLNVQKQVTEIGDEMLVLLNKIEEQMNVEA